MDGSSSFGTSGAPIESVDAHSIQAYYTILLAQECGMTVKASTAPDTVTLTAASVREEAPVGADLATPAAT